MSDHPDRDRGEICDDGVDTDGNGDDNTPNCSSEYRFDYMKAAARGWLELARNQGVQAGVISFNDNATPHGISAQLLDDAVTDTLGRTVSDLIWGGDTAIGSALQLAPAMFAATPNVRTKSVLLITDGDNNRGPDPLSVANTLREQNIRVFSVATGRASRSGILGDIADRTGGEFANSESARTLVNAFSRQWARQRGLVEIIPELYYKYPLTNRFTFPIAAGVSKVSLILAGNMDDMSGFGLHTIFDGPPGPGTSHFDTLVPHSQLRVVNDTFFQLIEILAPNPGTWDVEILPAAGAAEVQTGHLTLLAEDEQARLYAVLDRHVVTDPTVPVTLTITPIYHTFLRNLAALSAVVRRPDGTTITLPLVTAPDDLMYTGAITDLSQQGAYKVEVFMRTGPGTSNDPGESRWARLPPNSVSVPSYEAMAVENFVVRIPGGPLPNDTPDSATRLPLNNGCAVAQGNFTPENVQDYYQFSAPSGARVWATVDTGGSFTPPPTSRDSLLTIFKADGATIIEEDDNDGSGNGCDSTQESADASAIAGRTLVDGGTYFLRVQPSIRNEAYLSYQLFLNITTNPPLAESEPNNIPAEANTLVSGGEMMGLRSGSLSPSGELDYYAVSAPAGSLLHVSADVDPLRDGTSLTDLGLSLIAPDGSTVLYSADSSADPLPGESTAEGFCYRVAEAGVYYVIAFGKAAGTGRYDLMVAVKPSRSEPLILTMVPARVGSDFQFSFPTQPRVLYWVEQASTLKGPWTPWPAITGSGGVEVFRVPLSTGQSFFRLSTSP
jgi:hypothetical protein